MRAALEQLLLPCPAVAGGSGLESWREQIRYTAARAAKVELPLATLQQAFAAFRPLAVACLGPELGAEAAAAQEWLQQETQLAVAEAGIEMQRNAVDALLAVLDVELSAANLNQLLERLLQQAAKLFPLRWGEILLLDPSAPFMELRHAAAYGLDPSLIVASAGAGPFFQHIARTGIPGFLLDASNEPGVTQPYYRQLDVRSVWAVPLSRGREVLGILTVAFDRVYECLPKEQELL
ncbi:MAG: GAF domain-containing protein, partial [Terriglobales bacterium]